MTYRANINAAAHSQDWLEARARALAFKLHHGTKHQRLSPGIAGELQAITTELTKRRMTPRHKTPAIETPGRRAKRVLSRPPLYASGVDDVACGLPTWPPVAAAPASTARPYSDSLNAVSAAYSPREHSQYR